MFHNHPSFLPPAYNAGLCSHRCLSVNKEEGYPGQEVPPDRTAGTPYPLLNPTPDRTGDIPRIGPGRGLGKEAVTGVGYPPGAGYTAGGTPLVVKQEDFLILSVPSTQFKKFYLRVTHCYFMWSILILSSKDLSLKYFSVSCISFPISSPRRDSIERIIDILHNVKVRYIDNWNQNRKY